MIAVINGIYDVSNNKPFINTVKHLSVQINHLPTS